MTTLSIKLVEASGHYRELAFHEILAAGDLMEFGDSATDIAEGSEFIGHTVRILGQTPDDRQRRAWRDLDIPTWGTAKLKVGDELRRDHDHRGRADDSVTVLRKIIGSPTVLVVQHGSNQWHATGSELCAQNYSRVIRDGAHVANFFTRYW